MKRCGIYFLLRGKCIIYIGQSIDLDRRIYEHRNVDYSSVRIIQCSAELLSHYEKRWIKKFRPACNTHHNPGASFLDRRWLPLKKTRKKRRILIRVKEDQIERVA